MIPRIWTHEINNEVPWTWNNVSLFESVQIFVACLADTDCFCLLTGAALFDLENNIVHALPKSALQYGLVQCAKQQRNVAQIAEIRFKGECEGQSGYKRTISE
jgi:hypothetical protein